jgi:3-deoxy-D-manno-octulosonic-acid transferase
MVILYNISMILVSSIYKLAALFNSKARAFVKGRKNIFNKLEEAFVKNTAPIVWVHCASLGEFEQGRPLIEALKSEKPNHKILLTFFSPSGYEIRKNYPNADFIFYLPWDGKRNAKKFISITKPSLAIFIKYEFWYHYTHQLHKQDIPIVSASSIFRRDQFFFKPYGSFYRNVLRKFTYFFVQNAVSVKLLNGIGIRNCRHTGDTRFDRVNALTHQAGEIPLVERFKDKQHTWVIGSSWQEDMDELLPFINESANRLKFIIAPHEISESFINTIEKNLQVKSMRFSNAVENPETYSVLIIDNIGMLSKLYKYGEFAYVGGGFGRGLHNILEPACYGIPVFFGNKNYEKFQEANDLIMRGGAFEISGYADLRSKYELLISRPENYVIACEVTAEYIKENLGATDLIVGYCKKLLQ